LEPLVQNEAPVALKAALPHFNLFSAIMKNVSLPEFALSKHCHSCVELIERRERFFLAQLDAAVETLTF
jgi:hypothetical protein